MAPSVAFFSMGDEGHFQRMRALVAGMVRRGFTAYVFTHVRCAERVVSDGGRFVDLFAARSLADVDDESVPLPSRGVTFAAACARAVAREVAVLAPSVIIADTFAVIGRVVAKLLDLPHVNICAGHNMDPAVALADLARDPRVRTSARCWRAVEVLRDEFGIADASPFSYVAGMSPLLNVYCEPPAYLAPDERRAFEPLAFFGSLPERHDSKAASHVPDFGDAAEKIYVSFGTVIWRYYAPAARAALAVIADAVAARPDARAVISVGGAGDGAGLDRPNVTVVDYVDQWAILGAADVFVTHHGLNSTHEAVFHEVPMISYPFFGDQPGLAARCQELGLAIPLAEGPRAAVTVEQVGEALAGIARHRPVMRVRLAEARTWELETMARRDEVVERIAEIAACSPSTPR